jgi:hypothetical protein
MEFEQIYHAYFKSVYLYALQLSGNEQLAEEITSETFYKAIHAIDRFRGDCELWVWSPAFYPAVPLFCKRQIIDRLDKLNLLIYNIYVDLYRSINI